MNHLHSELAPFSDEAFSHIEEDAPRTLHPFPTRRSSDLAEGQRTGASSFVPLSGRPPLALARSEEHTSELQSRRDVVCRLLLEKKNRAGLRRSVGADRGGSRPHVQELPGRAEAGGRCRVG